MHEKASPAKSSSTAMPPIVSKQQSSSTTVSTATGPSASPSTRRTPDRFSDRADRPIIVQPRAAGDNFALVDRARPANTFINGWHDAPGDRKPNDDSNINRSSAAIQISGRGDVLADAAASERVRADDEAVGMRAELSGRREIVELLDAEPTLDYLVQNGVLTRDDVADIAMQREPSQQNHRLLRLVETRRDIHGVRLLTNVLRLTGQHYLANLLDDGARIKALSGSGYLSKSRHKGQVSVTIRIRSMQLPADPQLKAVSALLGTDWISLEDIQMKISSLKRSQQHLHTIAPHDVVLAVQSSPPEVDTCKSRKHGCCWRCCCCCCMCCRCCCSCCRRDKSTETGKNPNAMAIPAAEKEYHFDADVTSFKTGENPLQDQQRRSMVVTYQPGRLKSTSIECMAVVGTDSSRTSGNVDSLRRAADNIQSRCTTVYTAIAEPMTPLRVDLERYFEQDRGVLVLGAESLGGGGGATVGATVTCICTRPDHVRQFRDDEAERLVADLERVISKATGARVRLAVSIDSNDLDLADEELRN